MKTVEEVMDTSFEIAKRTDTVFKAVRMLAQKKERLILVADKEEIVGIITTTDIMYKVVAKGKDPKKTTVEKVMSTPVHAIGPGNTLQEAAEMLTQYKVKKLPVINNKGELLGVVSSSDILAADPEYVNMLINLQIPVPKTEVGS